MDINRDISNLMRGFDPQKAISDAQAGAHAGIDQVADQVYKVAPQPHAPLHGIEDNAHESVDHAADYARSVAAGPSLESLAQQGMDAANSIAPGIVDKGMELAGGAIPGGIPTQQAAPLAPQHNPIINQPSNTNDPNRWVGPPGQERYMRPGEGDFGPSF